MMVTLLPPVIGSGLLSFESGAPNHEFSSRTSLPTVGADSLSPKDNRNPA